MSRKVEMNPTRSPASSNMGVMVLSTQTHLPSAARTLPVIGLTRMPWLTDSRLAATVARVSGWTSPTISWVSSSSGS